MRYISCAFVGFLLVSAVSQLPAEAPRRTGSVRVIGLTEWDGTCPLPEKAVGADFDVLLPLGEIPDGAIAREVEGLAARRSGRRGPNDYTKRLNVFRWSVAEERRVKVTTSSLWEPSRRVIAELQEGDILVFH